MVIIEKTIAIEGVEYALLLLRQFIVMSHVIVVNSAQSSSKVVAVNSEALQGMARYCVAFDLFNASHSFATASVGVKTGRVNMSSDCATQRLFF